MAQSFQFPPKFSEIIDFAVVDDDRMAVVGAERLFAAVEIDDLQPNRPQRNVRSGQNSPADRVRDA